MLQREEKIVAVLLVMAVLSLIIGYLGFVPQVSGYTEDSKIGDSVLIEGIVLNKKMTASGGNLILSISDLDVNIFISKDNGAKEVYENLNLGDQVRINGKVAQYRNAREIIVESASDIKKL